MCHDFICRRGMRLRVFRFPEFNETSWCQGPSVSRGCTVARPLIELVEFEVPEVEFRRSIVQEWLRDGHRLLFMSMSMDGAFTSFELFKPITTGNGSECSSTICVPGDRFLRRQVI